jgi:hypothetical protein
MMERYFVKVNNAGEPVALYRLVNNDPIFAEEIWMNGTWQETDRLVKYLVYGEVDLEEVSLEDAKTFMAANDTTPNA